MPTGSPCRSTTPLRRPSSRSSRGLGRRPATAWPISTPGSEVAITVQPTSGGSWFSPWPAPRPGITSVSAPSPAPISWSSLPSSPWRPIATCCSASATWAATGAPNRFPPPPAINCSPFERLTVARTSIILPSPDGGCPRPPGERLQTPRSHRSVDYPVGKAGGTIGFTAVSSGWLFPGVLIAFRRRDPHHCHPVGGIVGVPASSGHNGQLTRSVRPYFSLTVNEHGQLRLTRQDEEQLVPAAVELPGGTPPERRDTAGTTVKREVPDRTIWLGIQVGEVHLNHIGDSKYMNYAALGEFVVAVLTTQMDALRRVLGTTDISMKQFRWALIPLVVLLGLWELGKVLARRRTHVSSPT
jgi:hypothetical protein